MKKIVNFILVLGILFLVFQFGVNFFKNSHSANYELKVGKRKISIHEEYTKEKGEDYYFFSAKIGNIKLVFDRENDFNKQKKIIQDIKLYQKDDVTCMVPIYIKKNDNPDVFCSIGTVQYSYDSIKDKYHLEEFTNTIDNFDNEKYKESTVKNNIAGNDTYKDNMYDDEFIIVYDYNDLVKITKPSYDLYRFATYDIYHNELGTLIGKYYILPKYENKPEYAGMTVIDITTVTGKNETIYFDDKISTNVYLNGVVDGKLYLFDKSNLVQYEIDPKKKSYRITGDASTGGQYYDGEWTTRNIYDFTKQELRFHKKYPIKANYTEAFETNKYYYYYNSKNEFYKVYKKDLDKSIFLFQFDNMKEISVIEDHIYFINNDTLYRYDEVGLKRILTNKEFIYNSKNIYNIYFK